ncbi:MAG: carboxyl transferase domain-containing protein, partial [Candidatus Fermentibacter daniensis]
MSIMSRINDFLAKASRLILGGGREALESQRRKGKLTVRERLEVLLDTGSFIETDLFVEHSASDFGMHAKQLAGDGVVTGLGKIDQRPVAVFAQDFSVAGGSLGRAHASK